MNKKTQNKKQTNTSNSEKKRRNRLLAIWIPVGAVLVGGTTAGIVLGAKSCNKTLDIEYVSKNSNLGEYTIEGSVGNDVYITFHPADGFELDPESVIISVGGRNLVKGIDFIVYNNTIKIYAKNVTTDKIVFSAESKPVTPIEDVEIIGLTATGFSDKIKGETLDSSDLKVLLNLNTGASYELSYAAELYQVQVSINGGEFKEQQLPYEFDDVGIYTFKVVYTLDASFSAINTITVYSADKSADVTLESIDPETMYLTATCSTASVSLKNNTINLTAAFKAPEGSKDIVQTKCRFTAYVEHSDTNDTEKVTLATTDYYLLNDTDKKTVNIQIPITSWGSVQNGDTIHISCETIQPFLNKLAYDDDTKGETRLSSFSTNGLHVPTEEDQNLDDIDHTIKFTTKATGGTISGYFEIWNKPSCDLADQSCLIFESPVFTIGESATTISFEFPLNKKSSIIPAEKGTQAGIKFIPYKTSNLTKDETNANLEIKNQDSIIDADGYRTISVNASSKSGAGTETGALLATYEKDGTQNAPTQIYQIGVKTGVTLTETPKNFTFEADNWENIPSKAGNYNVKVQFVKENNKISQVVFDETSLSSESLHCDDITQTVNMANPEIVIGKVWSDNQRGQLHNNNINLVAYCGDTPVGRTDNIDWSKKPSVTIKITDWLTISGLTQDTAITIKAELRPKTLTITPSSSLPSDLYIYCKGGFEGTNTIVQDFDEPEEKGTLITRIHCYSTRYYQKGTFNLVARDGTVVGSVTKKFIGGHWDFDPEMTVTVKANVWDNILQDDEFTITYTPDSSFKQAYLPRVGVFPDDVWAWYEGRMIYSDDTEGQTIRLSNRTANEVHVKITLRAPGGAEFVAAEDATLEGGTVSDVSLGLPPASFWRNVEDKSEIIVIVEKL